LTARPLDRRLSLFERIGWEWKTGIPNATVSLKTRRRPDSTQIG
jgi:hypothetical protein